MKKNWMYGILGLTFMLLAGCGTTEDTTTHEKEKETPQENVATTNTEKPKEKASTEKEESKATEPKEESKATEPKEETPKATETTAQPTNDLFSGYKQIEVDGGNMSGHREAKVVVDIGFGDRKYWAFTNEHGQLVRVVADKITLQDDRTEPVTSSGRYYSDEAKVPGVERADLDEGHIIADSLGGVSNAYNITPQESTLNRHGDQAYMEKAIRDAGGATNFEAIITYPNTTTQIPSHYKYTYTLQGHKVVDDFDNVNPDAVNKAQGLTQSKPSTPAPAPKPTPAPQPTAPAPSTNTGGDLSSVDKNGNGEVTIQEAKDAGYSMPITKDHWLYQYMRDNDRDGMVGEQ